jgi:spore coat protein SA
MEGALARVDGLRPERCFVIHNGADLRAAPASPTEGFKSDVGPVILFVGRIVEQKGLHVLLEAMPLVLKHFPTVTLRIAGGIRFGSNEVDPYLASLHAQAASLGAQVQFLGPVSHSQIGRHFETADIFACPSVWNDPFPLVILEAMGAGVPVVAFAKGGIPEAIGDAGILLPETSPAELAAALLRFLNDHELRRELAGKARERVAKHFTWDVIAGQWQDRLEQCLGILSSCAPG